MQSYTTQTHQRNYQGDVMLQSPERTTGKRHKVRNAIAASVLALAVAVTGGLLGSMTLHNQQLKHQVHTLETQTAITLNQQDFDEAPRQEEQQLHARERHPRHARDRRVPISDKQHATEPMPALNKN